MTDGYGVAGKHGYLMNGALLDECDPFWLNAQRVVRGQVKRYAKQHNLTKPQHAELLDVLGLA